MPAGFIKMLFNPDLHLAVQDRAVAKASAAGRIPTTQGRTLGGSSSINGMIYNRGQRADFDSWAQRGNRGWGYVDVLPYFKRTERRIGVGDDRIHGREGDLPVTDIDWFHPVCEAFIAGAVGHGDAALRGLQQRRPAGGRRLFPAAIYRGWRHSAARVFLHPARRPGGWRCAPTRAPPQCCSRASARSGVRYVNDRDRSDGGRWFARGAR